MIDKVEKLASKTSFQGTDLQDIKNIYNKYINVDQRDHFCMSCPGSLNLLIKKFKSCKDIIIKKIIEENGK